MKQILMFGCLVILGVKVVSAQTTACALGQGEIVKGVNTVTYCKSRIGMNWWSAHAWCDSIGKNLVNPSEDCDCQGYENCDMSLSCPNFKNMSSGSVWTSAVAHGKTRATTIDLYNGVTNLTGSAAHNKTQEYRALCK